jgi:hypothetical protein
MSKIVLVSYRPSGQLIAKGFEANGQKPVCFFADIPSLLMRWPFNLFIEKIKGYFYNKMLLKALPSVKKGDLLVMVKGNFLSEALRNKIQSLPVKKIAITLDSLDRAPMQKDICSIADLVVLQDKGDQKNEVVKAASIHLPLGFDEQLYKPLDIVRDIDVCLVGNFYPSTYGKRLELIHKLGQHPSFSGKKISVIGSSGDANLNESLKKSYPSISFEGKLNSTQINKVLNRTKVAVNIHQDDGLEPVNPWLFMIAGSGTAQVIDKREYLKDFFEPGEEIIMEKFDNIPDAILDLLTDDHKRILIADRSMKRALKDHSSSSRARIILEYAAQLSQDKISQQ